MGYGSLTVLFIAVFTSAALFQGCKNSDKAVPPPAPQAAVSNDASSSGGPGGIGEQTRDAAKLPRIMSSKLLPASPRKGDELRVEAEADKNTDGPVTFRYQWSVNGNILLAEDGPILKVPLSKGDKVSVVITPETADISGAPLIQSTIIGNSPPVASGTLADVTIAGNHFSGKIQAEDPDGDPLAYALLQGPKGLTVNQQTGEIAWDFRPEDAGIHTISVSVKDSENAEIILSLPLKVEFGKGSQETGKQ
jgi:Bacterial Ig domain